MTLKSPTGHLNYFNPANVLGFSADTLRYATDNTSLHSARSACIALCNLADSLRV